MTSLDVIGQIFENGFCIWQGVSIPITVQSFIGLALMVPEIMKGVPKDPFLGTFNGKKAQPE